MSVSTDYEAARSAWRDANLSPLWERSTGYERSPPEAPRLWPWNVVRPLVGRALDLTSPEDVERRALNLVNPRPGQPALTTTRALNAALQALLPGETARPHRHSINAIRFVMEGTGALTVVNGKDCPMAEGDLVLTPGWCWHEHVHHGTGPIVWLDCLDGPLQRFFGTVVFENGPVNEMPPTLPEAAFSAASVIPEGDARASHSPVFRYPYDTAAAAVASAPIYHDGARRVRYANPLNGGAAIATIDTHLLQIDPGTRTVPMRSTGSVLCAVVEGTGETALGETILNWGPKDIFTMPPGNWISHWSSGTARMFMASDREALARLGLLREEFGG